MISKFYGPSAALKEYIKYFIIFETSSDDFRNLAQCSIPYSCPVLIFAVSDTAPTFVVEGNAIPHVSGHIGGQTFSPVFMKPGNYKIIVALFQTIGAYQLFRIPQKEYLNQFISLNDILGKKTDHISEKIYDNRSDNYKIIREIQLFLFGFLKHCISTETYISTAISKIREKDGNIKIEELSSQLGINPRTMRRDFNVQVGMSPKEFSRMYRLNQLHKYLMFCRSINIQDLVYHFGYYDQSHLINDFKNYAQYSPLLLQQNIVLSHFLKADNYFEKFHVN